MPPRRPVPRAAAAARLLGASLLVALVAAPGAAADSDDVAYDAGLQWNLHQIGAEEAWRTASGAGTTIAIVDSGVALTHEDLAGQLVPGVACRRTDGDPDACEGSAEDDDGHGTHVAGVAAARTGNGVGIAGTAPDARIMPVKVLFRACETCQSTGEPEDVSAAVRWAADHGADVINLSLGSTASAVFGPSFADAVRYAWSKGAIPVVAAGNDYVLTADLDDAPAVVVSATDRDDGAPEYSNGVGEARWAVAAPGGDGSDTPESCSQQGEPRGILSTYRSAEDPAGSYACLSGSSMAAPHVSGGLALLLGAGLSPESAVQRLLDTAVDLGDPGRDPVFGAGRIDLAAALAGIEPAAVPATTPDAGQVPGPDALPEGAVPDDEVAAPPTGDDDPPLALVVLAAVLIAATATTTVAMTVRSRPRPEAISRW
ncbi:MAG TPA: S8 family serine peptidase [Acidimicrobiales bacterium]|nr:S8 family serine peptidase [Acidimicrobiales bacterium]